MEPGQLLAWAAVLTALATLVTAVGVLVKLVHDLREVKGLVNGNHAALLARLDHALADTTAAEGERDEARAQLRDQTNRDANIPGPYDPR